MLARDRLVLFSDIRQIKKMAECTRNGNNVFVRNGGKGIQQRFTCLAIIRSRLFGQLANIFN